MSELDNYLSELRTVRERELQAEREAVERQRRAVLEAADRVRREAREQEILAEKRKAAMSKLAEMEQLMQKLGFRERFKEIASLITHGAPDLRTTEGSRRLSVSYRETQYPPADTKYPQSAPNVIALIAVGITTDVTNYYDESLVYSGRDEFGSETYDRVPAHAQAGQSDTIAVAIYMLKSRGDRIYINFYEHIPDATGKEFNDSNSISGYRTVQYAEKRLFRTVWVPREERYYEDVPGANRVGEQELELGRTVDYKYQCSSRLDDFYLRYIKPYISSQR